MSCLIPALDEAFDHVLVHSRQHFSPEMSEDFFTELELPRPDHVLDVSEPTPARQLAAIIASVDDLIRTLHPRLLIVQGDTNTTLAGSLAASLHKKSGLRLVHVEAGARSHLPFQPEELNRRAVDQLSDLLLAAYPAERENLLREGIPGDRIAVVGSTVVAACLRMRGLIDGESTSVPALSGLDGQYVVATIHRQETVDAPESLRSVWAALENLAREIPVLLPLHPRTGKRLEEFGLDMKGTKLLLTGPLGYRQMISVLRGARFCLTDSGGLQEECGILGVPALVLRESTEHRRYVESGMHQLVGTDEQTISRAARNLLTDQNFYEQRRRARVGHDADTTTRIVTEIRNLLSHSHTPPSHPT